jgi:DNA-binding transcriptional LysR family regulator
MDLRQLQAFHAIVMTGSFSVAAERLHLTQSALSHHIKKLEEEFGEALLVRSKPRVYPTALGQVMVSSAEKIIAEMTALRGRLGIAGNRHRAGRIRVAATNVGLTYLYGDLCERFIERNQSVELVISSTETPHDAIIRVMKRSADVAFVPLPAQLPDLEIRVLGRTEHVFIVGPRHPLARAEMVSLDDISRFRFIRYLPSSGTRYLSDRLFLEHGKHPPVTTETNDTEVVKRIVRMGLAIALVPVFTILDELETVALHPLRLVTGKVMNDFGAVSRASPRDRVIDDFLDQCTPAEPLDVTLECAPRKPWLSDLRTP